MEDPALLMDFTRTLASASDEDWTSHYNAIENLRILNKYHSESRLTIQQDFLAFICSQIENLRSNNSRNALNVVLELVQDNNSKMSDTFTKTCMPLVLLKTQYDKKFISDVAKDIIRAGVSTNPSPALCEVLLESSRSKNLALAEFSVEQLVNLVKSTD